MADPIWPLFDLEDVTTGSWLGLAHQRQGFGRELRRATLTLAFRGFDAQVADTEAWHDDKGSVGVTRSLGYTPSAREFLGIA